MTPAPTVERSAVSQIPDPRQRQLIELVRSRDAAATSRLLEAWVHRRGLASLDTFRHDAVPALFSEADALWLEECIQEPLERRPLKPEATVEAQAPVPPVEVPPATALPSHSQPVAGGDSQPTPTALASVAPQAAILHPAGPQIGRAHV